MKKLSRFLPIPLLAWCLAACGGDEDEAPAEDPALNAAAVATYAQIVLASYEDSLAAARELDARIAELVEEPSEDALDRARDAWLASREPYLQTEVYRFYEGPIDNAEDGPEGLLNAWPMDEAYVDYVEDDAEAGIINDPDVDIGPDELLELNEAGGEENIATGYHALEFLLWGQDLDADGPGNRPFTDYVTGSSGSAENQDRRGAYLRTVSELLVGHLEGLVEAWADGDPQNYRSEFEGIPAREAMSRALTGMIVLSGFETGGERLQTALDTGDQEDEHSCFSDNTHRDMIQDIQGVKNVWTGTYARLDGTHISNTGLRSAIGAKNPGLASALDAAIEESLARANALEPPFDREISPANSAGRARVQALITALREQENLLEEVFVDFGFSVPPPP